MKTYTKTHSNKKAAETHLAKIKNRGGKATVKEANGKITIEYYFPEKGLPNTNSSKVSNAKMYDVISPDGITIRIGVPPFKSVKERDAYFKSWKERFEAQGYYSSNTGRIPLEDLTDHCQWIEI